MLVTIRESFYVMQCGPRANGGRTETVKFELYSRLDALSQLRDTFGIKQEPRMVNKNTFDETMRIDVEQALARIESEEKCSRSEAAKQLKKALV
jgi:hypothetical protein